MNIVYLMFINIYAWQLLSFALPNVYWITYKIHLILNYVSLICIYAPRSFEQPSINSGIDRLNKFAYLLLAYTIYGLKLTLHMQFKLNSALTAAKNGGV